MTDINVRVYGQSTGGRSALAAADYSGVLIFDASPDHATVTSYELRLYDYETDELVDSLDIGKPTPDGANDITYDCSDFFGAQVPGNYTLTVAAISPGGETESAGTDFSLPL